MKKNHSSFCKSLGFISDIAKILSIKPEKTQVVFIAEGLREVGSGLAISSILLIIIDKMTIFSEAGLCFSIFFLIWYTSLVLVS
jgi:hypothetical protein